MNVGRRYHPILVSTARLLLVTRFRVVTDSPVPDFAEQHSWIATPTAFN